MPNVNGDSDAQVFIFVVPVLPTVALRQTLPLPILSVDSEA